MFRKLIFLGVVVASLPIITCLALVSTRVAAEDEFFEIADSGNDGHLRPATSIQSYRHLKASIR
jgi:hypothetical protein